MAIRCVFLALRNAFAALVELAMDSPIEQPTTSTHEATKPITIDMPVVAIIDKTCLGILPQHLSDVECVQRLSNGNTLNYRRYR